MKRRVLRAAVTLAEEAERRIRSAGRVPPSRADLAAALLLVAADVTAAAKAHQRAAAWHTQMEAQADAAAEHAAAAIAQLADTWVFQAPQAPRWAEFDPERHRLGLVAVPLHAEGEPSWESA